MYQLGWLDASGTTDGAQVAGNAIECRATRKYLVSLAGTDHGDYLSRWILPIFNRGTRTATYPTLNTFIDLLTARLGCDLINKCFGSSYCCCFHRVLSFRSLLSKPYTSIPSISAMISSVVKCLCLMTLLGQEATQAPQPLQMASLIRDTFLSSMKEIAL